MGPNLPQLQKQLEGIDDKSLHQALAVPNQGIPQFLLMSEVSRRQQMRSGMGTGLSRPGNMREEMAQGMYQPVPPPPVPSLDQGGLAGLMPQQPAPMGTLPQQPMMPQAAQQQGLGGLNNARI